MRLLHMVFSGFIIILLFSKDAYMGMVHPQATGLEELVRRSDVIICAKKSSRHWTTQKIFIDPAHKYPPYERSFSHFAVKEVLLDDRNKIRKGKSIAVLQAYDGLLFDLHKRYFLEGVSKSPILKEYDCGSPYNSLNCMIIFLRYQDKDTLGFACNAAFEPISSKEHIIGMIKQIKTPETATDSPLQKNEAIQNMCIDKAIKTIRDPRHKQALGTFRSHYERDIEISVTETESQYEIIVYHPSTQETWTGGTEQYLLDKKTAMIHLGWHEHPMKIPQIHDTSKKSQ